MTRKAMTWRIVSRLVSATAALVLAFKLGPGPSAFLAGCAAAAFLAAAITYTVSCLGQGAHSTRV